MSRDVAARCGLGAVGVLLGLYGAYLFVSRQDSSQIWGAGRYLVGGVVFNDALVAVAVLLVGFVVTRFVPAVARGPIVVGAVVLGSVTLVAVPVLESAGAKADNATLLDRDYGQGWWIVAAVVVVAVLVSVAIRVLLASRDDASAD